MVGAIHLRDRLGETEKITINVGFVDLGHIDLLVHEGFYSNRTDFIRTAIRNQLASHADAVKQSIVRLGSVGTAPARCRKCERWLSCYTAARKAPATSQWGRV